MDLKIYQVRGNQPVMRFKNVVCTLVLGLGSLLGSQEGAAAYYTCPQNPNAPLSPTRSDNIVRTLDIVELDPGKYWGTNPLPQIDNPENFKCDNVIPDKIIDPSEVTSRQAMLYAPVSNSAPRITFNGKTFFRLSYTGSSFLDTYGYVSGELSLIGEGGGRFNLEYLMSLNLQADNAAPGFGFSLHDLQFLFTKLPTSAELGRIKFVTSNFNFNVGADIVKSEVNPSSILPLVFVPPTATTCNVNADTIELQPMRRAQIPNIGETFGNTHFSITAVCPSSAVDQELDYILIDNVGLDSNSKNYFTTRNITMSNGHSHQSNVWGVVIEEQGGTPVMSNTKYSFGTLAVGQTIIKKDLVAKYLRPSNGIPNPGEYIAQASVLVQYK